MTSDARTINIAMEFSSTPGARYRSDGPYSGEEFREAILETALQESGPDACVEIVLDGTEGYATSFLEEAFGGLARKLGCDVCLQRLRFRSEEDPLLVEEIQRYIRGADE